MPKFSIITICRNEAEGIGRTCESIANQEFTDYEWIVIDGVSTDGTLEELKKYEHLITKLISEPDEGIYDAMNKGLQMATGDYLLFMNGGDAFVANQVLNWVADAPDVDIIYGNLRHGSADGPVVEYPDTIKPGFLLKTMLPHQASFCHRRLYDRIGNYDTHYRIAADYDFFVRALEISRASHHYINKAFATFDLRGISSSKRHRLIRRQENHHIRMAYFPDYHWSLKSWKRRARSLFFKHHDSGPIRLHPPKDAAAIADQLTIIIVSYNSEATIRKCMHTLLGSPPCRILIVDNASPNGSAGSLAECYPTTTILRQTTNLGYGRGANVGLREVQTPYALLLNPDIMATTDDINALLEAAIEDTSNTAIWGPSEINMNTGERDLEDVSWISGCAMLFDMAKLNEVGLFDENIFLFFEETELCTRALKAGYSIKRCRHVHFEHLAGQSSPPSPAIEHLKDWHYGWSKSYYHEKLGLSQGKRSPRRMLATYRRKALFAIGSQKRAKYRSHAKGAEAFLEGARAFLDDGRPREAPMST